MNKNELEQFEDEIRGSIKEEQSWLMTYADMMTLLFAFFVLLFSMSTIDPVKISQLMDGMGDQPELKSFNEITNDFQDILEELDIEDQAKVSKDPRGVTLEIDGDICFESGSTQLHSTLSQILDLAAQKVLSQEGDPRLITIEGHTDSDPIPKELRNFFPTNWELSSARASKVVNYLIDIGVNSGKLQASGYADRWPASLSWYDVRSGKVNNTVIKENNTTDEQKKLNRRIKIVFSKN
jgi:chemotaxis protein MotB